ncbi:MAG: complex I NDUFA9 subunit family protein [Methylacidiphilales bacterium]|nr:complex I NDUFA9 subunit family protein [Candidatus Methylacidiphilales bacterium]
MILVTGGTGFVGREVVRELLALGYTVRLLARDPKKAVRLGRWPSVEIVAGDALKPDTLPAAVAGVDAVIHLIGIIAETARVSFEQAHVEATHNVLAAAKQAGVTRWIQMSAAGTRPHAVSRYHITKWEAEELVRRSGLDWTIFRPSLIYGYDERDRFLNLLRLAVAGPALPLLDDGLARVQPVSVRDVARSFALAVASNASLGRVFDLVGPEPLSWREMILKVARARGRDVIYEDFPILPFLRAFLWLAIAFLPVAVIVGLWLGRLSLPGAEIVVLAEVGLILVVNRWRQLIVFNVPAGQVLLLALGWDAIMPRAFRFGEQLKMAVEDNVGDPRPAAETLGYAPESFESGLNRLFVTKR